MDVVYCGRRRAPEEVESDLGGARRLTLDELLAVAHVVTALRCVLDPHPLQVGPVARTLIGQVMSTTTCDQCGGDGKIAVDPCHVCHGRGRLRQSEYRLQLREKQKTRRYYQVLEKQFRAYYEQASRQDGVTGENLLRLLESRFDNVIVRLDFAASRRQARQLINHGHWLINGRRVPRSRPRSRSSSSSSSTPSSPDPRFFLKHPDTQGTHDH